MTETLIFLLITEHDNEQVIFDQAARLAFPHVKCIFAENCEHAIASVKSQFIPQPDIIFLDWPVSPNEPGECFRQLKNATELKGSHIIGLSDQDQHLERSWKKSLGVRQMIQKQSDVYLLSDAIFKTVYNID